MIDRIYKCNLCRDIKPIEELHGLYWTDRGWVKRPAHDCKDHICNRCLFSMQSIAVEYESMRSTLKPDAPGPGDGLRMDLGFVDVNCSFSAGRTKPGIYKTENGDTLAVD